MVTKTTETKKRVRSLKNKNGQPTTDWQALAKHLQKALEKEMDENKTLVVNYKKLMVKTYVITKKLFKAQGVIEYLEEKNGNDSV